MTRSSRLFDLVERLRAPGAEGGHTVEELARDFDVSSRTIFRDLAVLEERGLPLASPGGRYHLHDPAATASREGGFDSSELAIVRLALGGAAPRRGGPIARRVERLVAKIDALLGGRGAADREHVLLMLDRLARAGRTSAIRYRSLAGQELVERTVDPWKVFHRGGAWWLVGRCHAEDAPRFFRLDRVVDAAPTGRRFRPPAEVDLERLFDQGWADFAGREEPAARTASGAGA